MHEYDCGCRENTPVCSLGKMLYRMMKFYAHRIKQADFPNLPVAARDLWITSYQNTVEKYRQHVKENKGKPRPL